MRLHPVGTSGQIIDRVTQISSGMVTIKSKIGSTRIVNMLSGE
jgi:hydrogenase maturation factor